jgi:5-methylcytosine-specific restriction endonuclease McrA
MKQCTHYWEWKDESEFNWRITGVKLWGICRECQRKQKTDWYDQHKEEMREAKNQRTRDMRDAARQYVFDYLSTHPCVECGESDPMVLEFDHLGEKDSTIAKMVVSGTSIATIQREIDKCQVLCANCHRRKTTQERGWFRSKH